MRRFWHNCKGAVTVMVTLLLIPAVLITGTGVDLARIYVAYSTLHDANQLAANSVLASYDALLQDLYGLFGIMRGEDTDFADMADEYVKLAVFGEDWVNRDMGTFQLFYGSDLQPGEVVTAPNKNLSSPDVLRRQIEEYMKYRAPGIIVEEIMGKLDVFEKVREDARVIQKKMQVDDGVEEVDKLYREIYNCINQVNPCDSVEKVAARDTTQAAADIQDRLGEMSDTWEAYAQTQAKLKDAKAELAEAEAARGTADSETGAEALAIPNQRIEELRKKIQELEQALKRLEETYRSQAGHVAARSSRWDKDCKEELELLQSYIDGSDASLEKLAELCKKAEEKKEALEKKIKELEEALDRGKCSSELERGLREPPANGDGSIVKNADGTNMKSLMEQYKDLLKYDLTKMADAMIEGKDVSNFEGDRKQIEETIKLIDEAKLGGQELTVFGEWGASGIVSRYPLPGEEGSANPLLVFLDPRVVFSPKAPGFKEFQAQIFSGQKNDKFYQELDKLYAPGKGDEKGKKNVKDSITKIFETSKKKFGSLLEGFNPEGAKKLEGAVNTSRPNTGSDFGCNDDHDWSKENEGKKELENALDSDFLSVLANTAGKVGDKLLLLVYDTEMFSDYSTPGKDRGGAANSEASYASNMAGIPLSPEVNYYFQSELEYLYNGNLSDAVANLKSVAGMIFLIRFVFDYVASFTVSSVNDLIITIKTALSWTGPFSVLAGELARLGIALGESALDVQRLRAGDKVAVYKSNETWKFSVKGLTDLVTETVSENAVESAFGVSGDDEGIQDDKNTMTMTYKDYMRLFLLLVDGDTLALRTANLIQLNVTNYRDGIHANEEKMEGADLFDLSNAVTDFSLTTTAEVQMLFLSMPFAQEGVNGRIPPGQMAISVRDDRGY